MLHLSLKCKNISSMAGLRGVLLTEDQNNNGLKKEQLLKYVTKVPM